ncbi:MAG TPA: hypothetical protein DCZ92_14030 [Elusimicrobia bacterium]|nr:MAG: hypothetical protein A2016_05400 [Elusimicrobia bacterium GWF2_62_30]HBA61900.1 hypothetical protein [Elusimicrobiota bacterium]
MRYPILSPLLAAFALLAAPQRARAQAGGALTLDEAVQMAVRSSPAALAAEQDITIAKQRVKEARFISLPQLSLSATASRVNLSYPSVLSPEMGERYLDPSIPRNFYTFRVTALQPVYAGGKNDNTLKLAKTASNQAKVNYETARSDAALAAKKAFYTVLYRRRLNGSAAEWLARASAFDLSSVKNPLEAIEARALLAGFSDRVRAAGSELDSAVTELLGTINREPGYKLELDGELEPLPITEEVSHSLVTAMESRPDLKSEMYKAQMDDIAVSMALVRRNPTVYLGASYDVDAYKFSAMSDSAERSENWLASLAIHFPLSYDIWTQVRQRKAQQRQGELKRVELQDRIRFEIFAAHKEALFQQDEAQKRKSGLERMKADYAAGAASARDPLPALRAAAAVADMERGCLEAVYRQLLARIRLEWAQGRDIPR